MIKDTRYQKVIKRNLYELAHALLELKVLTIFEDYMSKYHIYIYGESFFNIVEKALFNDMIAHAIKALDIDKSGDSTPFWYLLEKDEEVVKKLESYSEEKIDFLRKIASKLKIIRDRTHFHIDKKGVLDPQKIWEKADIKGAELKEALETLFYILNDLHQAVFGKGFLYQPDD